MDSRSSSLRRRKEEEALDATALDPSTRFLYKPHTITVLLTGGGAGIELEQAQWQAGRSGLHVTKALTASAPACRHRHAHLLQRRV